MRTVLVTGPPCAGKTTFVDENRTPATDVVLDFDTLAHALGYPTEHVTWPADDHPARLVALRARASALKAIADLTRPLTADGTVWIVQTSLHPPGTIRIDKTVTLDPGRDECVRRAQGRDTDLHATVAEIDHWYAAHGPTDGTDGASRKW
jgi:hypothetical protein